MSAEDREMPEAAQPADFWTEPGAASARLRQAHGDIVKLSAADGETWTWASGVAAHKAFLVEHLSDVSYLGGWQKLAPEITDIGEGIVFMDGPEHRWYRDVLRPFF